MGAGGDREAFYNNIMIVAFVLESHSLAFSGFVKKRMAEKTIRLIRLFLLIVKRFAITARPHDLAKRSGSRFALAALAVLAVPAVLM